MIYLLDGNQEVIKIVRSSAIISAIQTQELPEDNSLLRDYLSVRLKNDERLFNAQYMAVKSHGGNRNAFDLYRIASEIVPDNATEFMGVQVAPYELEGVVIEDLRPQNRPLNQTMSQVLEGSDWRLGYVSDNLPNVTTNFYYVSVKDALKQIQELLNVEMLFKVEISGNKITDKWVEVYHQLGNRTMKRFNYGTNALSVVRESSHDELYTALIGRGKGEEVGETESGDATYGRKINFADVEWMKSAGKPVDKPKGQKYIELPNATAEYGIKLLDGRKVPRIGIVEFNDTDDPNVLINQTYQELLVRARPKVLFKASVINTGDMLIGDTVTIHRHDLGFHYQARVRKVVRDRKNNNQTQVEIGDVVHTPSTKRQGQINSALNNVASDLESVRGEITEARSSADGKNTNFYGNVEPDRKKVGDTWFRDHPSLKGESQILVWNGEAWELIMDTSDTTKNAEDVLEAKGIAETARDNALNIATDLLEGTSFYKHTQDIGLASKNSDGTINSIINLGNDGTAYVGGENIVLDGNTIVDGTFTITDEMIAPNADIDGAKIQDATIGSAKIANLDVDKITGNTSNFVSTAWNTSANGSVYIDGSGIHSYGSDGDNIRIDDGLVRFYSNTNEYNGAIGTSYHIDQNKYSGVLVNMEYGKPFSVVRSRTASSDVNDNERILYVPPYNRELMLYGDLRFSGTRSIYSDSSELLRFYTDSMLVYQTVNFGNNEINNVNRIMMANDSGRLAATGSSLHLGANSELRLGNYSGNTFSEALLITTGGVRLASQLNVNNQSLYNMGSVIFEGGRMGSSSSNFNIGGFDNLNLGRYTTSGSVFTTRLVVTSGGTRLEAQLNANGHDIVNQSDGRLKRDIENTNKDSLGAITNWNFVDFNWLDNDKDKKMGRQFGVIAQDTPELASLDAETNTWTISSSKQIMTNSHAIQQLALREQNTNLVASQALEATESNESKIYKLQQELSKANRRIEELESVM